MTDIKLPALPQPTPIKTEFGGTVLAYGADQLRARDIEVARVVLEAAAKVLSATYLERQDGVYVELPSFDGGKDCASAIRALEVSHD